MSNLRYNKTCMVCGSAFVAKTCHAKYCSTKCSSKYGNENKNYQNRYYTPVQLRNFTCKNCGETFVAGRTRKYCKKSCRQAWHAAQNIAAKKERTCKQCGAVFMANQNPVYCSDECRKANLNARATKARYWERYKVRPKVCTCEHCGYVFNATHNKRFCSKKCNARNFAERRGAQPITEWKHGHCQDCSAPFERLNPRDCYCVSCKSVGAVRTRKANWMKINGKSNKIDYTKIFERDGWRCYICGIETPQHLSRTYEHNSPEIDHIMPLSKGGKHVEHNVANSCFKCNHAKGAKIIASCRIVTSEGHPIAPEHHV